MHRTLALVALVAVALGATLAVALWNFPRAPEPPVQAAASETVNEPASANDPEAVKLPPGVQINFVDVTRAAGVDFKHFDGRTDMQYIMSQTGSGLAWIDYDQDGLLDLFLVQGNVFVPPLPKPTPISKLYRNLGHGKFQDVTAQTGLAHVGCGQGVAVGDIDNDGYPDLVVTCYGQPNALYHNVSDGKGGRRFVNITAAAGFAEHPDWKKQPNYATSAAFFDYDNDGYLDLFVCHYVKIDLRNYPKCLDKFGNPDTCPPLAFDGTRCYLFRNNGDLTFRDVSHEAGIDQPNAKGLGVIALDLDDDGLIDVFVANDGVPNFLFRNRGGGRFEAFGPASGCAVNFQGHPQAYMGVDADDLDGDGRPDLFVTAFARETNTFFRNLGDCRFLDMTHGSGLGPPSWYWVKWGTCFLDVDRDGSLDIVVANGHVSAKADQGGDCNNPFRQKAQLFLNDGTGHFTHVSAVAGGYFQEPHVGRGVAAGDYDNDGHMDLAISNSGEPAVLLHNESTTPNHWVRLQLQGTKSNRDAVGAKLALHVGPRKLVRHRKGGGSYCSANDPRLLVGLGPARTVDRVEVRWPSGLVQQFGSLAADGGYRLVEGIAEPVPIK
jgi:hypothetical protein